MLKSLICKTTGHSVDRQRVWHDGLNNRTRCTRCRIPLIRNREGWEVFDPDDLDGPERLPHPATGEVC